MSELRNVDLFKFEKLFWMENWYILDFSNYNFTHFVIWSIWVDPYDDKYNYWTWSKANRLRWIIKHESNLLVWQLLLDLLEVWLVKDNFSETEREIYFNCVDICNNLKLDSDLSIIEPKSTTKLNHDFINEQIRKCNEKIVNNDFNWAITNARSFLEAVIIEIIEEANWEEVKNDWNVKKLFTKAKNILNLENRDNYPFSVTQILGWIDELISWLASLSNNLWDRHANKFKTQKHHAKLAINSSMTIADFLIDSRNYQNK